MRPKVDDLRVLVTGGAGFIGSAVCRALVRAGQQVINFDALTYAANARSLDLVGDASNYHFVRGDIRDATLLDAVFARHQPDAVINLAAETHVDRSIGASQAFVDTNIVGTHALLEASRHYWEGLSSERQSDFRFIHVSTDEVFGSLNAEDPPFDESSSYRPRSPYAASKAASDHLVRAWWHTYGLPIAISNCSNNYGPFQFPEKFIPLMIVKALQGLSLPLYGDGKQRRDWIYVDDHVRALLEVLKRAGSGATYMIGGRSERTNLEVAEQILDLVRELAPRSHVAGAQIEFVPDRPGHDWRYGVDCSRVEVEFGWRNLETFEAGLRRTVQWYIERRDWWEPILERTYRGERLGLKAAP